MTRIFFWDRIVLSALYGRRSVSFRRCKDLRRKQQDLERDRLSQQREIERLQRELQRSNAVTKHLPASLRLSARNQDDIATKPDNNNLTQPLVSGYLFLYM